MTMPLVAINNLSFTYNGTVSVLRTLTCRYTGQFLTITGPSGCGKSTLALCLAGLFPMPIRENDRQHSIQGRIPGIIRRRFIGYCGPGAARSRGSALYLDGKDEIAFGPKIFVCHRR